MSFRTFYDIWLMLLEFSSVVWDFFNQKVGTFVWDFLHEWFIPPAVRDPAIWSFQLVSSFLGYSSVEDFFIAWFDDATIIEFILTFAIVYILGFRFVTWLLDLIT